ncbi:hypothetical protein FRB97_005604 [Tulasnella sp. 331]|nr:hypothetical protein FRB97_005604 [Tulasnella sp. 331]
MTDPSDMALFRGEAESTVITTSLEIEQIDSNIFRSKVLYHPSKGRGVFGGAQASAPIIYLVDRVRQGKTYATRAVKAVQFGQVVFVMLCSFQIPEPSLHSHQWPMPSGVPSPDQCETTWQRYQRILKDPRTSKQLLAFIEEGFNERMKSPIEHRLAKRTTSEHGTMTAMHWMRARNAPIYEAPYQKAILAYASDIHMWVVINSNWVTQLKSSFFICDRSPVTHKQLTHKEPRGSRTILTSSEW